MNKQPTIGEIRDGNFFDGENWIPLYYLNYVSCQADYIIELLTRLRKARKEKKRWKKKALAYKKENEKLYSQLNKTPLHNGNIAQKY